MRRYDLTLTLNTRDIGGYTNKDGIVLPYFHFIRSDAPRYFQEEDVSFLLSHNVDTVIDLRTPEIAARFPSSLAMYADFDYHLIPLHEGSMSSLKENENISDLYMKMVNNHKTFYEIFKTIADAPHGVFYNCTAGKDRTGVVTYLLLSLAGVDEETVIHDFEISSDFIEEKLSEVRKEVPTFPHFLGYSKREYMDEFLPKFKEKYIDAESYLRTIGLSEEDIECIKDKLLKEDY